LYSVLVIDTEVDHIDYYWYSTNGFTKLLNLKERKTIVLIINKKTCRLPAFAGSGIEG